MKVQLFHFETISNGLATGSSDIDYRANDGNLYIASPEREKLLDDFTNVLYWVDRAAKVEDKIRKAQRRHDETQEETVKKSQAGYIKLLHTHLEECCEQLRADSLQLAKQASNYTKCWMDE